MNKINIILDEKHFQYGEINKESVEIASRKLGTPISLISESLKSVCDISLVFPENISNVRPYGFSQCDNLHEVKLNKSLKTISECAFLDCFELRTAVIPENVETIEAKAFNGCYSLTNVNLPASLKNFGSKVFQNSSVKRVSTYNKDIAIKLFNEFKNDGNESFIKLIEPKKETFFVILGHKKPYSVFKMIINKEDQTLAVKKYMSTEKVWQDFKTFIPKELIRIIETENSGFLAQKEKSEKISIER